MEAPALESESPSEFPGPPALGVVDGREDDRDRRREFRDEALPHLEDLYAFALRLTGGDEAEAEDLVQTTMLRAFRSWETYELGTNCGAWLRTILRNAFVNRFRKDQRNPESAAYDDVQGTSRYDGNTDLPGSPEGFDRPDLSFFEEIIDGEVVEAVEELAAEFRVPLVLVDLDGMSYRDAAEELGIPEGTVKSRLYRARRRLRERLVGYAREMGYIR